jgi:Transglycosylase SLT domain
LPTLARFLFVMPCALSVTLLPASVLAWDEPAGSPPAWQSHWVKTIEPVEVFADGVGDVSFGRAAENMFFRVDAPEQHGRLWVYNPITEGWAWVPRASTRPVAEPTTEQVEASARPPDPRAYLYARAPDLAPRLDCIIAGESGWDPSSQNPRTRAAGLAQFLPSTWATTPEGQRGLSPFEPLANIDAAIWLARTKGWTQWQVYAQGRCR